MFAGRLAYCAFLQWHMRVPTIWRLGSARHISYFGAVSIKQRARTRYTACANATSLPPCDLFILLCQYYHVRSHHVYVDDLNLMGCHRMALGLALQLFGSTAQRTVGLSLRKRVCKQLPSDVA
jgi:hypothetical protein